MRGLGGAQGLDFAGGDRGGNGRADRGATARRQGKQGRPKQDEGDPRKGHPIIASVQVPGVKDNGGTDGWLTYTPQRLGRIRLYASIDAPTAPFAN